MTVNELPPSTDLAAVRLRLPDRFLATMRDHAGGEPEMYLVSFGVVSWFSPDPPHSKKRRLYPTLPHWDAQQVLSWEVVE